MRLQYLAVLVVIALPGTFWAQTEVATIPLDNSFGGSIAVDSAGKRVYVANQFGANTVQAFDTFSLAPKGSVGGGGSITFAVDAAPSLDRLFVAAGNTLTVLKASTMTYESGVSLTPIGVGVNRQTNQVYVVSFDATIRRVDGATMTEVTSAAIPGPGTPCGFNINCVAVNEATNRVYVAGFGDPGSVQVFDGTTLASLGSAPASFATGIAVDSGLNRIFVAVVPGDAVLAIDGVTNTVIGSVGLGGPAGFLGGLAVNPKTHRLYVARRLTPGKVSIIDGAALTLKTTVTLSTPVTQQLAVDPLSARVFARSETASVMSVIQDSPPCTSELDLTYAGGRLTMAMVFGSTYATTRMRMWLVTASGIQPIINTGIGVIDPPRNASPSFPLPAIGNVGGLLVLDTQQPEGYCWAFDAVYTGGSGPTIAELKDQLRRAGITPPGFGR